MAEVKKKGASYRPDSDAQAALDKNTTTYESDSKWFLEPKNFKNGEKYYFRLVGWSSEVTAHLGMIQCIPVRKYMFGHPCKKSKKDPTKKVMFNHVAELSFHPSEGDSVLDFLKAAWQDPERKERLARVFYHAKYNNTVAENVDK